MGVLECDRYKCDNIMCDRYSHHYGYICSECFKELVRSGPETNIESFMESSKKMQHGLSALARFDLEFPMT